MPLRHPPRAHSLTVGRKPHSHEDAEGLPTSDGVPMENEQDAINARLYLCEPLKLWCRDQGRSVFVGSNSFVYHTRGMDPCGPDFYVVNGGVQTDQPMWVVWREDGRMPSLIVEFLSPSTQRADRTRKFALYRDVLKCSDYVLCKRENRSMEGFRLRDGEYVQTKPDRNGRLRCASLPLRLGFEDGWLRFFTLEGALVPTEGERERGRADAAQALAEQAQALAEQERALAEQERARAEQERALAERERARAEQALAELRDLRRRLGRGD